METKSLKLCISSQEAYLLSILQSLWKNRCIAVIVGLKIPEILCQCANQSMNIDEIASKTGCETSDKLYAVMKILSQWGIGEERENKHFAANATMKFLRRDEGPSVGHAFEYYCGEEHYSSLRCLGASIKTSRECSFVLEHGIHHFTYMNDLEKSYEAAKIFQGTSDNAIGSIERRKEFAENYPGAMAYFSYLFTLPDKPEVNNVYKAFPWSTCKKLIDIGGSSGQFLASVLSQEGCEHIDGYVMELPKVVDDALLRIQEHGPIGRKMKFIKHDIFLPLPDDFDLNFDTLVLKQFIHMFLHDKTKLESIFSNCSAFFSPQGGRLLIIDLLAPDGKDDSVGVNALQLGTQQVHWIGISKSYKMATRREWIETLESISKKFGFKFEKFIETFKGGQVIFEFSYNKTFSK